MPRYAASFKAKYIVGVNALLLGDGVSPGGGGSS